MSPNIAVDIQFRGECCYLVATVSHYVILIIKGEVGSKSYSICTFMFHS